MNATAYEYEAHRQILAWREKREDTFSKGLSIAASPIVWATSLLPARLTDPIMKAIEGATMALKDGARHTYSPERILSQARRGGLPVASLEDLKKQKLEELDKLARSYFDENKLLAAIEGAGTGFGGIALIAADIPAVFGIALRSIQQIGTCYGFDMKDPEMQHVILSILSAASGASITAKSAALADMRLAAQLFARNYAYQTVAERTATGVAAKALKEASQKLPRQIAQNVSRKKLSQILPVAGALMGAGFNYWFLSATTETAYMMFRALSLSERNPRLVFEA